MKEITSQLNKLERQAKSANIYTELKSKERDYKLKLLAIKWNDLSKELESISKDRSANEIELEKYNASITNKEKGIEILREKINDEQNNIYLAKVKKFEKVSFTDDNYNDNLGKQNSNARQSILRSYDIFLNDKYEVTLNQKTIQRVKNFYQ